VQYFHFLFTFAGRSLGYLFCGLLTLTQWSFLGDLVVGAYMILLAVIYIRVGYSTRQKLQILRMRPEAEVMALLRTHDADRDGKLNSLEMARLLRSFDIEWSPQEVEVAMLTMDTSGTGCVTVEDMSLWRSPGGN